MARGFASLRETEQAAPPGQYLAQIVKAVPEISKKSGASMIHLTVEIEGGDYDGQTAEDYWVTDPKSKGARMAKGKMRGVGTPAITALLTSDAEIPDNVIAQEITGWRGYVTFSNQPMMGKSDPNDPSAAFDQPMTIADDVTGQMVPWMKLNVVGYAQHGAGARQAPQQAPVYQQAPAQPQYQQVPQQAPVYQQAPQQAPQFAPQGAPQGLPQGQPNFGMTPAYAGATAPAQQPQYAGPGVPQQPTAQPVWNGGQPPVPPPAPAGAPRVRRVKAAGAPPDQGEGQ